MEFNKAAAEAAIQDCINKNLAPHLVTNGVLEEGHRVMFLGKCEALQSYFVEQAAQGLSYKTLKENIRQKIEELKAAIDKAEADYNRYYPPQGHTTMTVIHLDEQTGERTPEERTNVPSPGLFHFVRFKNSVLINFLSRIEIALRNLVSSDKFPAQEEILKQEARAKAILQQAQALAETKLQAMLADLLPVETLEFIQEEAARIRQSLKRTNKPQYHSDTGHKVLAGAFLTFPKICLLPDNHFIEVIAGRIAGKRYLAHLKDLAAKALADTKTQAGHKRMTQEEFISFHLQKLIDSLEERLERGMLDANDIINEELRTITELLDNKDSGFYSLHSFDGQILMFAPAKYNSTSAEGYQNEIAYWYNKRLLKGLPIDVEITEPIDVNNPKYLPVFALTFYSYKKYLANKLEALNIDPVKVQAKKGPGKQEATTKKWALVYKYRRESEPHLYSAGKKALIAIGDSHGVSGDSFYNTFLEVCAKDAKPPNPAHIREAMQHLAEFPEALKRAEEELLKITEQKK